MNLIRRQFMRLVAGAAALPAASRIASAQTYDLDHPCLSGLEVDRAVNIDPLAPARLFDSDLLLFWCPAAGWPRRMGRMYGVRERHGLVVAQGIQ